MSLANPPAEREPAVAEPAKLSPSRIGGTGGTRRLLPRPHVCVTDTTRPYTGQAWFPLAPVAGHFEADPPPDAADDRARVQVPVRLIAFDIDGTLMPSSGAMAERTRAALRATAAAGIEVVIATGRRQAYAAPLLEPIGLAPETILITSNGTVTRDFAGHTLDRSFLPIKIARDLCAELRPFGGTTVYTFDRIGRGELVLESIERLHDRIALWVEANAAWIEQIDPLERAFDAGEAPIQGMVCGTVDEMNRAEQHLLASPYVNLIEMHRTEYAARDLSILDILPRGCSKGVALAQLAERRGVPQAQVMAIGDNWNDLEMLRWAGQPVLMANAPPELRGLAEDAGWEITATNDEYGVAVVLERLLEQVKQQQPQGARNASPGETQS